VPAEMVVILAGEFLMGSSDADANDSEKPVHPVYLDAFYMDKYPVTNEQYKVFLDACPQWQKDTIRIDYHNGNYLRTWHRNNYPKGAANHPVVNVSWYAAMAYAQWAEKRLPTEAEWEKAARGGLTGKKYPWGDQIDTTKANYGENIGQITSIGEYPPNDYGVYDIVGNVWEWCLDEHVLDFYAASPRRNPVAGGDITYVLNNFTSLKTYRVLRGGSWMSIPRYVRVAPRFRFTPSHSINNVGFRCVRSASL
jgi:formylglycine-generating enzyme required for sulfatase activity